MSAVFDVNSLSREELDQISQLIHKKTMMLDKNYFQNNDDVMKFISRVAMKSESRESFWRRLSTKLDSMPVALQNSQALSTHSTSRDMDIFLWFQKNLKKLQSLLGTLSARGTENILLGKLTEALNIATHCANVSTLSGPQLCLLRELHTAFYSRSANGKQNNSQSSLNSSVAVSSSGPLVSGKNLSPPTFLSSSSAPVAMRAYTGPNSGPLCGPIPNSVSSMPSNGRFLIAADAIQLQDHCLQERRQKESDWISNFYKKVYAFQRLLHNKGCAADKSVESKIDIKGISLCISSHVMPPLFILFFLPELR